MELIEAYVDSRSAMLTAAALVLKNRDEAEDAVQDAILALYRRCPEINVNRTYLTKATKNAATDIKRAPWKRRREPISEYEYLAVPSPHVKPFQQCESKEVFRAIGRALLKLPARHRRAFLLTEVEGCSPSQVAAREGCNRSVVAARLVYARKNLRELLIAFKPAFLPRKAKSRECIRARKR